MAASTHWMATATAHSVLERGGNAFDAAVAAAFVLHLVEPHLNGPGGDLCAVYVAAGDPAPQVLVGQGSAPARATIPHYREAGFEEVPGAGLLAAAVPGAVPAWLMLLEQRGTWELEAVLAYAIDYAWNGVPISSQAVGAIASVRELFRDEWITSAAQWLPAGELPDADDLVRNRTWARTLERLVSEGRDSRTRESRIRAARDAWSTGFVAQAIEAFVRTPSAHPDGSRHAGVLTARDLAAFEPHHEQALSATFRGVTVAKTAAWGQGPVLLQALAILDGLPDERLDPATTIGIHTIAEALKLALADRDTYYGDGAPREVIDELVSREYGRSRAVLIEDDASADFRPGSPARGSSWRPALRPGHVDGLAGTGEPTIDARGVTRGDTSHLDIVDRFGNLISATPSGGWLQSSPYIPEVGFCLGTRLQMTWLDERSPSALTPGRRPRTTLSPTLLLRDGVPFEALGTPGGDQQDQWQLLYLLRRIVGGYTPQQAIDAPAFHTASYIASFEPRTWAAASIVLEDRHSRAVVDGLRARGHDITVVGPWDLGRISAVGIDHDRGGLYAAANPRGGQGYAVGR